MFSLMKLLLQHVVSQIWTTNVDWKYYAWMLSDEVGAIRRCIIDDRRLILGAICKEMRYGRVPSIIWKALKFRKIMISSTPVECRS